MISPLHCNTSPTMETNLNNNSLSTTPNSSLGNRYSPSQTQQLSDPTHIISQPYSAESSNFGPFYHHHHHHHGHIPSYGNPYDKFKIPTSNVHSRSPNASPYGSYQGFYTAAAAVAHHHHHHQIVRPPNGYIDLVPR